MATRRAATQAAASFFAEDEVRTSVEQVNLASQVVPETETVEQLIERLKRMNAKSVTFNVKSDKWRISYETKRTKKQWGWESDMMTTSVVGATLHEAFEKYSKVVLEANKTVLKALQDKAKKARDAAAKARQAAEKAQREADEAARRAQLFETDYKHIGEVLDETA